MPFPSPVCSLRQPACPQSRALSLPAHVQTVQRGVRVRVEHRTITTLPISQSGAKSTHLQLRVDLKVGYPCGVWAAFPYFLHEVAQNACPSHMVLRRKLDSARCDTCVKASLHDLEHDS